MTNTPTSRQAANIAAFAAKLNTEQKPPLRQADVMHWHGLLTTKYK